LAQDLIFLCLHFIPILLHAMKLTSFTLMASGASAANIVLTNSAMTVPGNTTIWSLDTTTGSAQLLADHTLNRPAQAAVVCNNVYYTVWADIMAGFGLRALDLASGEATDLPTSSLFHVIACDPKDSSKLLGTASDFTSMPGAAVGDVPFHLKSYDTATKTEAIVGIFPASEVKWGGYDGIFSFTQDGTEVWAAWPADECPFCDDDNAKKGGHVHIMDTSSGEIKTSTDISFGGKKGTPYFLLPDEKRGVFATKTGSMAVLELKWADLEVGSNSIKAKIGSTDATDLWISSEPAQTMCGDHLISFSKGGVQIGASSAKEILPATGAVINSIDLRTALDVETDRTFFGAVA
jgi:hypothetical protein